MSPDDLVQLLGIPFTQDQLAAACAPLAPGLIVAGAGSGKTSVMAARVVWLVGTGQVEADRVLGLTFTNKAAAELAQRIRQALLTAGLSGPAAGPAPAEPGGPDGPGAAEPGEPTVSTYHAFAGRLVSEHGLRLGVEPRSRLLADATRYQLAGRVLRRWRQPIEHLNGAFSTLIGQLVSLDGDLSEHLVSPAELRTWDTAWLDELEQACAAMDGERGTKGHCDGLRKMMSVARRRRELADLVVAYREAKADLDAIDFGDQVALGARLAEAVPEVGALERERYDVVLLDEYQDTSVAQRRMLAGLFGGGHPVTAVGDPCQAIYGWRGASVSNLDGFPEHFRRTTGEPAATFSLAVNQRSGGRLLRLANTVAAVLRRRHTVVELTAPPHKAALGSTVVALHGSWSEETAWLAAQLRALVDDGTPPGECAVLVRARSDFADLYAALSAQNLPVEVVGLGGLLALPEVADVVATLEVVEDPTANAALLRLLTGPRWRLGARDLARLGRQARELLQHDSGRLDDVDPLQDAVAGVDPCDVVALTDALERPGHDGWSVEALQRVTALNAELRQLRAARDEPLLDLAHRVVEVTGLEVELAASPEAVAARRRENLSAFLDVVAGFTDLDGESSLASFLAFLRAAQEYERGLDAVTPSGSDAIQLLTAHKAKGLEWDVVACPDLTDKVFPVTTMRERWTTSPAMLPGPLRGDAADQPDLSGLGKDGVKAYDDECRAHLEREERRLGYVAFTRARSVLLGSGHWWGPTQKKRRGPSPFLRELREHADGGNGRVEVWVDQPEADSNPSLDAPEQFSWPTAYEPAAYARRYQAASDVLADLAAIEAGAALPADLGLSSYERERLDRFDREALLLLEEARQARRGLRDVALPTSLSASQLMRLQADEEAFARELARPMPRSPAAAARRGTRFHAWVETLFEQRPLLGPDELPGAEDDLAGGVDDLDLQALQQAFLASDYAARRPHQVEAPFVLPLGGRVLRGRIDAVYDLGGGQWEVVDWKTGTSVADPLQLAVYRLAWARLAGVEVAAVRASFLYVASGDTVSPPDLLDEAALLALLVGGPPPTPEALTLL